jgi:ribonucleoside-diphosphate reductase beta chain
MTTITVFDKEKEEILRENKNRFVLFPIKYNDIWDLYVESISAIWTVDEIDLTIDMDHWKNKLDDNTRFFIKNILAFFAFSDGIVNENLAINFYNEIQIPEARNLYASQILIEAIHSHMYSTMIDTFISNSLEKEQMFNSLDTNPIVKKKADWALKWLSTENSFPERLIAFGVIEGVFFSGSFCAIFWLKSRGLMPGLSQSNSFISRDEALHCRTCVMLYLKLEQKLSEKRVHEIFMEAYKIEEEFITKSIPVSLIGMNTVLMTQYIKYICDYWLKKLGYKRLFKVKNPFNFMEAISIESKANFFEKKEHQYSKANVGNTQKQKTFSLDADF